MNYSKKEIILASANSKKIAELSVLLENSGFFIRSASEAGFLSVIDETGNSFMENAVLKAEAVMQALGCMAVADDSGLEVYALDNEPGVYSARYAGQDADDETNNEKLLAVMRDLPKEKRGARFVAAVAVAEPGAKTVCFTGVCEGEILHTPRGESGFGYDPLFLPKGKEQTFAEMPHTDKNAISHRGIALRLLQEYLHDRTPIV